MQRDLVEEVFLLNPRNRDFVCGRRPAPVSENPLPILILKWAGAALVLFFTCCGVYEVLYAIRTHTFKMSTMGGYTDFVGGCGILFWLLSPRFWPRRFSKGCQMVSGVLISCKRLKYDRGASDWRMRYWFLSPTGRALEGESSTEGTLLKIEDRSDPSPGTPVVIAYLNDKTHRML
jgi:hypothetical protein